MSVQATESTAQMPEQPNPDKYAATIAELKTRYDERYGLIPSRYFRWISGDMPDAIRFLVEHRELAMAVLKDAIDYEVSQSAASEPEASEE